MIKGQKFIRSCLWILFRITRNSLKLFWQFQNLLDPVGRRSAFGIDHEHSGDGDHSIQDDGKIALKSDDPANLGGSGIYHVSAKQNDDHQTAV